MTTDEATRQLAEIYMTGDPETRRGRAAEGHLWEAEERAGAEDWSRADGSLVAAYRALGAKSPAATADDLGRGQHPIQVEAERMWRMEVGEG